MRELVPQRLRLVELHALRGLLAVERGVHRTRCHRRDRDATVGELLGRLLGGVHDRLAQHPANRVHGDVDAAELVHRGVEQLPHIGHLGQVALHGQCPAAQLPHGLGGVLGVPGRGFAVVMHHNIRARLGELPAEQATQVFAPPATRATLSCNVCAVIRRISLVNLANAFDARDQIRAGKTETMGGPTSSMDSARSPGPAAAQPGQESRSSGCGAGQRGAIVPGMSRTTVIIIAGLVLFLIFLIVGYLWKAAGLRRAMEDFVLVWFAVAAFNLAVGVFEAGYGFGEELPIFLLIFAIPAAPAIAVRLYAARSS